MIPDFLMSVTLDGHREHVMCRDVPAAVFFYGYPALPSSADGYRAEREQWIEGVLARAILIPRLSVAAIHRLAIKSMTAREDLEHRYMAAIGWEPGPPVESFYVGAPVPTPVAWAAALAAPPSPAIAVGVLALARMFHVPPAAIWLQPISEYLLNQVTVLSEREPASAIASGLSALEKAVGMEDA